MTKNKNEIVMAVCRNCGTHTVGRWCHACGQDLFAGRGSKLRELAGDILGNLFALDGKVPRTLWYLVAFPGRLTREFYSGRIVRYVYPSKLFWFITIVFFALLWNVAKFDDNADGNGNDNAPDIDIEHVGEMPSAVREPAVRELARGASVVPGSAVPAVTDAGTDTDTGNAAYENAAAPAAGENVRNRSLSDSREFQNYLTSALPYAVLLLVPAFALLVWLFFRRRERSYGDYLVFSLHFVSFQYLIFAVWLALRAIFPDFGGAVWFFFMIPGAYLCAALRNVFRPRVVPLILRVLSLGIVYAVVLFAALVLFLVVSACVMDM